MSRGDGLTGWRCLVIASSFFRQNFDVHISQIDSCRQHMPIRSVRVVIHELENAFPEYYCTHLGLYYYILTRIGRKFTVQAS